MNSSYFFKSEWEKRKIFFNSYKMVYLKLIVLLKWKNDYVYKKKEIMGNKQQLLDDLYEKKSSIPLVKNKVKKVLTRA